MLTPVQTAALALMEHSQPKKKTSGFFFKGSFSALQRAGMIQSLILMLREGIGGSRAGRARQCRGVFITPSPHP